MSLEKILKDYTLRLEQMNEAVNQSAAQYSKAENELKTHLANHNALLGARTEAENAVGLMQQTLNPEALAPEDTNPNQEQAEHPQAAQPENTENDVPSE